MEGEGGQTEIIFTGGNWKISGVINLNGNVNISGDSYSINGNPIFKNYTLKLEDLGRLETLWVNKGFSIIRNTFTSLNIIVKENSTGEDFNFVIVLESEKELKEIVVKQKKSQGYRFKSIEYMLMPGDGDSVFVKQNGSLSFNISSPQELSFSPFYGINRNSYFGSSEDDAFIWTEADSLIVEVPSGISNGEIYYNGDESVYTNLLTSKGTGFIDYTITVTVPEGISKFSVEVQYRRTKVSYILYLLNNRTNQEKVIKGKWFEFAPTGNYTINREN